MKDLSCRLSFSSGSYDKHIYSITNPKPHRRNGASPWGWVEKAKGWPWSARGSCQTSSGQWALYSHIAWAHPRGMTPPTHGQHSSWLKSLPHAQSSRADYSLASLCRPQTTFFIAQPQAVWWDHRSRWAPGFLTVGSSGLKIIKKGGGVELIINVLWLI